MLVVVMGSMKSAFDERPEPFDGVGMHLAILTSNILLLFVFDSVVFHEIVNSLIGLKLVCHKHRIVCPDNILDKPNNNPSTINSPVVSPIVYFARVNSTCSNLWQHGQPLAHLAQSHR